MFIIRKVEDLQFTIEEQSINQDEVEVCENLFSLLLSQIFSLLIVPRFTW